MVLCILCLTCGDPRKAPGVGIGLPDALSDHDALAEHMEMVHCIPVRKDGESLLDAMRRVGAKNPRIGTVDCTCPDCMRRRRKAQV